MSISKYLIEKSNGLLKEVPEYRDEGLGYTAVNDGSTECEVLDFLYGMVRILKPRMCLETGTYKGFSSAGIAQGLKDNNTGVLDTLEIEQQHIETSKQLWNVFHLLKWIRCHHIKAEEFVPTCNYDLIFLDSEPFLRMQNEILRFYPYLNFGGYMLVHDLDEHLGQTDAINPDHPDFKCWPWGVIPQGVNDLLKLGKLVQCNFPNPRGLTIFFKPKDTVYKPK